MSQDAQQVMFVSKWVIICRLYDHDYHGDHGGPDDHDDCDEDEDEDVCLFVCINVYQCFILTELHRNVSTRKWPNHDRCKVWKQKDEIYKIMMNFWAWKINKYEDEDEDDDESLWWWCGLCKLKDTLQQLSQIFKVHLKKQDSPAFWPGAEFSQFLSRF